MKMIVTRACSLSSRAVRVATVCPPAAPDARTVT